MSKPILIAICGETASGKDTLKEELSLALTSRNIENHVILHDTTRPPRRDERNKVNYTFLPKYIFMTNILKKQYLEWNKFHNWYYGTRFSEIKEDAINIGVFSPFGIEKLADMQDELDIYPVYLKVNTKERFYRAKDRDGKVDIELLRRIVSDKIDFWNFEKDLQSNFTNYVICDNININRQIEQILIMLRYTYPFI